MTRKPRIPTPTEVFVHEVAKKSFLSLWSYASPEGKTHGREMCDILVVCDPDVIIFSVKEVKTTRHADNTVRMTRWVRTAVDESVDQIYGAERFIQSGKHKRVRQENGTDGLPYPPKDARRIHRVAVALGGEEDFPLPFGDFGRGFVHVFNERSFRIVTSELDTISDFVEYLTKKEAFFSGNTTVMFGHEEDIVAVYLHENRTFPEADTVIFEDGAWQEFITKAEVQAKKLADEDSYLWDRLIERIGRDVAARRMISQNAIEQDESVLRVMARENRFNRRVLAGRLLSFFEASAANKVRSRMIPSMSGVGYVFLTSSRDTDRELRNAELGLRCFIARLRLDPITTIIGIGTEQKTGERGASWDVLLVQIPTIDEGFREQYERMSKELGYFHNPIETHFHEDEYPGNCPE